MTEVGTELDRHFAGIAVRSVIIVAGGAVRFVSAVMPSPADSRSTAVAWSITRQSQNPGRRGEGRTAGQRAIPEKQSNCQCSGWHPLANRRSIRKRTAISISTG